MYRNLFTRNAITRSARFYSAQSSAINRINMGVTKETLTPGNGSDKPKAGDNITMEYTGWLEDTSAKDGRGKQFDSSVGRGDFKTKIGVGQVIKGWDEGVPQMTLGEKAVLTISGDYAYGQRCVT